MFDRVLIANRGEIACRIARTVHRMGGDVVAVYSDPDAGSPHVQVADRAVRLPGHSPVDTYLNIERIVDAARETAADAVHPGYGFLAEHPDFPRAVRESGRAFVGPSADVIEAMGMKRRAKNLMEEAGVPVVPDERGDNQDPEYLAERAKEMGLPVLIKAVAGGGGKGMRRVDDLAHFLEELEACRREAKSAFDDDRVLIEKYIAEARHVEVQVFGDDHGNGVHLFERDCSIQRRYQKIIEEAPAPGLSPELRDKLGTTARRAVDELDYTNAGTMEFILDASSDAGEDGFYFMEMNTRLQVEHPITEMITGEDLVEWQLRVADGEPLPRTQDELSVNGHAFEARLYAEDPAENFQPRTGTIQRFVHPDETDEIRLDTGVEEGTEVNIYYDPLLAKLIVHGPDREAARRRMEQALSKTGVAGLTTNTELLLNVFRNETFKNGHIRTDFIGRERSKLIPEEYGNVRQEDLLFAAVHLFSGGANQVSREGSWTDPWAEKTHWRMNHRRKTSRVLRSGEQVFELEAVCTGRDYECKVNGKSEHVSLQKREGDRIVLSVNGDRQEGVVIEDDEGAVVVIRDGRAIGLEVHVPALDSDEPEGEPDVRATMPGTVIEVLVEEGEPVNRKDPLLVMEAMKMEMTVQAERSGEVQDVLVSEGDQVQEGNVLVSIQ